MSGSMTTDRDTITLNPKTPCRGSLNSMSRWNFEDEDSGSQQEPRFTRWNFEEDENSGGQQETRVNRRPNKVYCSKRFIEVSSDGESLVYSPLGAENLAKTNIVDEVFKSLKILGEYSEDSENKFVNDRSYLRFLLPKYLPDRFKKQKLVHIDLNVSEAKEKCYAKKGKLDFYNLITWIVNHKEIFKEEMGLSVNENLDEGGKFVSVNVLTNFFHIPYYFSSSYKFYATSVNGVTYMMKDYEVWADPSEKWVNKFKQCMTKEDASTEEIGNENFRAVLSSSLGPHKLLYPTSLHCVNIEEFDENFTDLSAFLHLKCLLKKDSQHYRWPDWLSMVWYMEYIISGVSKLLVGYRNNKGVVSKLQLLDHSDMLQMGKNFWNPANCLIFSSKLLSFIKSRVESEPGAVFCIRKDARRAEVTCRKEPGADNFLPDWFRNEIFETTDAGEAKKDVCQ